jgi:hypothetical protein
VHQPNIALTVRQVPTFIPILIDTHRQAVKAVAEHSSIQKIAAVLDIRDHIEVLIANRTRLVRVPTVQHITFITRPVVRAQPIPERIERIIHRRRPVRRLRHLPAVVVSVIPSRRPGRLRNDLPRDVILITPTPLARYPVPRQTLPAIITGRVAGERIRAGTNKLAQVESCIAALLRPLRRRSDFNP